MIALRNINEHHAMMSAVVAIRQATVMSRRGVIMDKSQDMGKPPRCGKGMGYYDKLCIMTNYCDKVHRVSH